MPERDRTLEMFAETPSPLRRRRWLAREVAAGLYPSLFSVLQALRGRRYEGATDREMARLLQMNEGTARGRLCELTYQCDPPLARVAPNTSRGNRQVYVAVLPRCPACGEEILAPTHGGVPRGSCHCEVNLRSRAAP